VIDFKKETRLNSEIYQGDCLEVMDKLIEKGLKFDAIITDPPYGTTACSWDSVIPFDKMWERLNKLIKDKGAIVLFGNEPFSSYLRMSNIKNYKYDIYWQKERPVNILQVKKRIGKTTENIMIFYKNQCIFNPQKTKHYGKRVNNSKPEKCKLGKLVDNNNRTIFKYRDNLERFPIDIIKINRENINQHPTQKPVKLLEYLVKTYTNEGDIVLDFTIGSGTTGVACINTNRKFVGIELDEKYFEIAKNRIDEALVKKGLKEPESKKDKRKIF